MILQIAGLFLLLVTVDIGRYGFLPEIGDLRESNPDTTAFVQYREIQWENEGRDKTVLHRWVPLAGISSYLQHAVLIAEDDKFWDHEGFDFGAQA